MERYQELMAAVKILATTRTAIYRKEKASPAWVKVLHAENHVHALAAAELAEVAA